MSTDFEQGHIEPDDDLLSADSESLTADGQSEAEPALKSEVMQADYIACIESGDSQTASKLQWQIALVNENLIWWWARKLWQRWKPHSLTVQDLAHYGMFGMLRAIEKYRASFETKLSTYAGWWIRRSIDSAIFENGPTIRIPEYRINQKAQIDAVVLELLEQGHEPTLEHIARELNTREEIRCSERPDRRLKVWTTQAVDEVNLVTLQIFSSFDRSAYDNGAEELHSYITVEQDAEMPDTTGSAHLLKQGFRAILAAGGLSERDRVILELYFYGESRDKATVAQMFGITKKQFGAVLADFLEAFPELFKLANAQRSCFLSLLRFANLPEHLRRNLQECTRSTDVTGNGNTDQGEQPQDEHARIYDLFRTEFSSLSCLVDRQPELLTTILRFAHYPPERRMMLGVFFCGDDLTKHDIAILGNVTRERVRQIIDDFSEKYRGPLSRLFMGDFESPREICEKHILHRFKTLEGNINTWLKKNKLAKTAAFLKMVYIERLPRRTIAQRCGGLQPGTITNRLKRAAARLQAAPPAFLPFFCSGHVGFSPREILARQVWEFLTDAERTAFTTTLDKDQRLVFNARLALNGRQQTLRTLSDRLGKTHVSDVGSLFEQTLHDFFDWAADVIKTRQ